MSENATPEVKLPVFFKDENGFCYVATPAMLSIPGLTPYNGEIDERGMAVDGADGRPVKPATAAKAK
jgi:hypothetical protein